MPHIVDFDPIIVIIVIDDHAIVTDANTLMWAVRE